MNHPDRIEIDRDWLCDTATTTAGCLPVIATVLIGWVISVALIVGVCVVAWWLP